MGTGGMLLSGLRGRMEGENNERYILMGQAFWGRGNLVPWNLLGIYRDYPS